MPGSHTDFPPGERSPLVSIADLPAAVPVARSAAPASPTSVQTASAAAWRSAASDARSRFRATAVAHVAPAPRLSMLPPEEDSDPEASWLPCAEYRMNLRAAIRSAQKKLLGTRGWALMGRKFNRNGQTLSKSRPSSRLCIALS